MSCGCCRAAVSGDAVDHVALDDEDRSLLATLDLGEDSAWDSRVHEEW